MIIYLDNCMYNRPYDDQLNFRVVLETEAKLKIQESIRTGQYQLVWSYILDYENEKNPFRERRRQIATWKKYAAKDIEETASLIDLAREIIYLGIKIYDSLHIACSIQAEADYFITTDNGIIKKRGLLKDIQILDPTSFIRRVYP